MARLATFDLAGIAWPIHATTPRSSAPPTRPSSVVVLRFALPHAEHAAVIVHDAHGHLTRTLLAGELAAGEHACCWDGRDDWHDPAPAGEYTVRLEVEDQLVTARRVSII